MSDSTQHATSSGPEWWLLNQGTPEGPYGEAYVIAGLRTGVIFPQTQACPAGAQEWKPLGEWPAFASVCATLPPPLPPSDSAVKRRPSWNPYALAWLGLLFWPAWTGIMAALNIRRLGLDQPLWRPLAIGVGSTVAGLSLDCAGLDSIFVEVVFFMVLPLVAIWHLDLFPQVAAHAAQEGRSQDHWIVPVSGHQCH